MSFFERLFHKCFLLERRCKGISGMILWCHKCERRFVITWDAFNEMNKGVVTQ